MTDLVIRPARQEEASFLAWAVVEAARSHRPQGFWDLWIPDGDARLAFVEHLTAADSPSMWHWTVFHVAEWRGRPAATLSGCDPSLLAPADVAVGEVMVSRGWSEADRAAAIARATPFFGCMHETPPGAWLVESVATRPEERGHGLDAAIGCPGIAQMSCTL